MENFNDEGSVLDEVMGSGSESDGGVAGAVNEPSSEDNSGTELGSTVEKLSKAVEGIQSMVGKWGNEMGEMRQMFQNQPAPAADESGDGTDPFLSELIEKGESAIEERMTKFLQKHQTQQSQQQQQVLDQVKGFAPDFEEYHDDIVSAIATDSGANKAQVASNLHTLGPGVLVNAYKRVQAEKRLNDAESLLKAIKSQGTVDFDQAKRALAKRPGSGDTINPPSSTDVPKVDPYNLTDEQRKELMKQRGIIR